MVFRFVENYMHAADEQAPVYLLLERGWDNDLWERDEEGALENMLRLNEFLRQTQEDSFALQHIHTSCLISQPSALLS